MTIYVGTDPEFFIVNKKGKPVPAHEFFPPKSKALPSEVDEGAVYRDGFAVELNPTYSHCRALLGQGVRRLLSMAYGKLPTGYRLVPTPAIRIQPESLEDAPDDVQQFGCDGAFDAYTGEFGAPNIDGRVHPWRYAGGHLHVSGAEIDSILHQKREREFILLCDQYVGLPLTYWFASPAQFERRKFYGRAGEYRVQTYTRGGPSHGIEYRTPSPQVWNHMAVAGMALGAMRMCAKLTLEAEPGSIVPNPAVQRAINTGKGLTSLLPALPGLYTRGRLVAHCRSFRSSTLHGTQHDLHTGWGEYVVNNPLP